MLTARGRIKVLDFGIAKRIGVEPATAAPTHANTAEGVIVGTVHYMSPEQAPGRSVDARSDIFSAGVMMYELLTGQLPFTGSSAVETLHHIVHGQPDSISRLNHRVPPGLERIVTKTLDKELEQRYQTARDVLTDLSNLKRDDGPVAPRARTPKRTSQSIDSLAVLPLLSTTTAADMDYLADGITTSSTRCRNSPSSRSWPVARCFATRTARWIR